MTQDQESADNNTINVLPDRTKPNRPPETKPGRRRCPARPHHHPPRPGQRLRSRRRRPHRLRRRATDPKSGSPREHLRRHRLPDHRPRRREARHRNVRLQRRRRPGPVRRRPGHTEHRGAGREHSRRCSSGGDPTTMLVEQGKTVSQNILTDWTDPDGDDLVLMDAKADNDAGPGQGPPRRPADVPGLRRRPGQEERHRDRLGRPRHHHRQGRGQRPAAGRPAAGGQRRPRHRRRGPGPGDRAAEERRRPQRRRAAPGPGGGRRHRPNLVP